MKGEFESTGPVTLSYWKSIMPSFERANMLGSSQEPAQFVDNKVYVIPIVSLLSSR